jgi:UDP-glucuronate 4-epimerase
LVTGGAGFIGSHLAGRLLQNGWRVLIFDSFDPYYDPAIKRANVQRLKSSHSAGGLTVVEGDVRSPQDLQAAFALGPVDLVAHLAALVGVRPSLLRPVDYHDVNVGGSLHVLQACREHRVSTVLFASSSSVYGGNKKIPFAETDDTSLSISPYAATKKAGEVYAHVFSHLYGMRIAALRFFTVYGPCQRPDLAIHRFVKKLEAGQALPFYGDGRASRDYTYVDDIVDGIMQAQGWLSAQTGACFEVFNLGNSRPVSLADLVRMLERITGKRADLERLPPQPGDMENTFADLAKSRRMLGYEPKVSLETGLTRFVDWFRTEGPLRTDLDSSGQKRNR